jgi:hypothetical protein
VTAATPPSTPDTSQRRKNKTSCQIKTVRRLPPSSTANPSPTSTPSIASDIATTTSDTAPQDQDIVPDNTTDIPQAQVTQQNVPQIRTIDTTAFDTPSTHQVPETSNITADTNVTTAPQEQDFDTLDIDNTDITRLQDFSTTAVLNSTIDPKLSPALKTQARNAELDKILKFLINPAQVRLPTAQLTQLIKKARHFFTRNGRLWRKQAQGRHQLVLPSYQRLPTLREAHNDLGHRGYYSTVRTLLDRFWWPTLAQDIKTHIQTCHECQLRQTTKIHIPPTVAIPAPLFRKAYIDTMLMPPAASFRYIVQARCSLTAWPEWRALRVETSRTLAAFIFEDILCRWGAVEEIVTDNGAVFVATLDWLTKRYGIRHIRISAYNSRANGIVEHQHRTIRESIVKACDGNISRWPIVAPHAFWADRATTRKSTGHTLFFMAHGIEPVLPFDITLATFLVPDVTQQLSTADLIAVCMCQLQRRESDLAAVHSNVLRSRFESVKQFEHSFERTIWDHDFQPSALVLVRNSAIETDLSRKSKPRYFGPMVVIRRSPGGAYRLAELDGAVSRLRYAAFRLVPYHTRSSTAIQVTQLIGEGEQAQIEADVDAEGANEHTGVSTAELADSESREVYFTLFQQQLTEDSQDFDPPADVRSASALGIDPADNGRSEQSRASEACERSTGRAPSAAPFQSNSLTP